jgi:translation initiation factor 3 subunit I
MTSTYKTKNLQGHERPIKQLKFSIDGKYIYSASADRKVIKWNYKNCSKDFTYEHQASVNVICLSNSNTYMFTGDSTGCIYVWDINNNELIKKISFDKLYNITSINISSDDVYLIITCSERGPKPNNFIPIYLVEDIIIKPPEEENKTPNNNTLQIPSMINKNIKSQKAPEPHKKVKFSNEKTKYIKSCFTNMNKSIIISREDGFLDMYDFTNDNLIFSGKFHNNEILDFDVNYDNGIIITSSKDGEMSVINLTTFQLMNKFKPTNPVRLLNSCQIAVIDNPYYMVPGTKKEISVDTLFDLNTMDITNLRYFENENDVEKTKKYKNKKQIVLAIVGGGQDSKFVTTTTQKEGGFEIIIYNVFTGEKLAEFLDHFGPINTLAVHKNILASGGEDSSVKVHDIEHYLFS